MSDAFGFTFGFYGLLLGLALAELATGFSHAYDIRSRRRLGLVAPLFGLLLIVDLITFWTNAWAYRELADVRFETALAVALVALLYYFAATKVFPRDSEHASLDDHIMGHRHIVISCVLASNLLTQIPPAIEAATRPWPATQIALWATLNILYYVLLITAGFARSKRLVIAVTATAIVYVTTATALLS